VPAAPSADQSGPSFDLARIEKGGDAVIAGRAAPGATVDLMRNGERLDGAVADASGQFVIVPPRLPAGDYALTLRAKSPDGQVTTSKQSVAVSLKEAEAPIREAAAASTSPRGADMPETTATVSPPRLHPAKPGDAAASQSPHMALASVAADEGAASRDAAASSRVVVRGDSLWRISRLTYGAGQEYALVYRANRNQIRDPNLIHPGQVLILPVKHR
jgi:nucleoid-associated protein YgaU